MRSTLLVLLAPVLAACAMSQGVQKMGPDTYMVSAIAAPIRGGASGAELQAVADANTHCAAMGKEIMVTNTSSSDLNRVGAGQATVTFRCLATGDRDLRRPNYEAVPTAIIKDTRR